MSRGAARLAAGAVAAVLALGGATRPARAYTPDEVERLVRDAVKGFCDAPAPETAGLRAHVCDGMVTAIAKLAANVTGTGDDPHGFLLGHRSVRMIQLLTYLSHDSSRHYYPLSIREYRRWHDMAVRLATLAREMKQRPPPATGGDGGGDEDSAEGDSAASEERPIHLDERERAGTVRTALLFEAFALHYLIDLFSPSHGVLPQAGNHRAVNTRIAAKLDRGGLKASDQIVYFGTLETEEGQRQAAKVQHALKMSLASLAAAFETGNVTAPAQLQVPYFGWDSASEDRFHRGRRSELLELGFAVQGPGSGVSEANGGPRLAVDVCRHARLIAQYLPLLRQTTFEGGHDIDLSWKRGLLDLGAGLRHGLGSYRFFDLDLAADATLTCSLDERTCDPLRPRVLAGLELYQSMPSSTTAVVLQLKAGVGRNLVADYGFQWAMGVGMALW